MLAPRASEVGLGAAALAPLWADIALAAARGGEFREVTFCAQVAYFRAICSELDVHFGPKVIPSSPWEPKVPQMAPRRPKGAKVTPRRAPWEPKAPQRLPKGGAKSPQGAK